MLCVKLEYHCLQLYVGLPNRCSNVIVRGSVLRSVPYTTAQFCYNIPPLTLVTIYHCLLLCGITSSDSCTLDSWFTLWSLPLRFTLWSLGACSSHRDYCDIVIVYMITPFTTSYPYAQSTPPMHNRPHYCTTEVFPHSPPSERWCITI